MIQIFFRKSGFIIFLTLLVYNFVPKISKIGRAVFMKNWYPKQTDCNIFTPELNLEVENCNVVNDGLNVRKQKDNQEIKKNEKSKQMLTNKKRTNKQ